MTEIITIFTDGSSTQQLDTKGLKYGGIGVYCPKYPECNAKTSYMGSKVTNQRMELLACIQAIKNVYKYMTANFECKLWNLIIYTDSMYVINAITVYCPKWILYDWHRCINKKRKTICNLDLLQELYTLSCTLPITYKHIKGHSKQPLKSNPEWDLWFGNKKADEFSRKAMEIIKNGNTKSFILDTNTDNDNDTDTDTDTNNSDDTDDMNTDTDI